jgi:hypothetical protein
MEEQRIPRAKQNKALQFFGAPQSTLHLISSRSPHDWQETPTHILVLCAPNDVPPAWAAVWSTQLRPRAVGRLQARCTRPG